MRGNMADVPFKNREAANVDDPRTHKNENRNTPTATRHIDQFSQNKIQSSFFSTATLDGNTALCM
jgi:hypothetical protein